MNKTLNAILDRFSVELLLEVVSDIRKQADNGLISRKQAHDVINFYTPYIMRRQMEEMGIMSEEKYEEHLWKEPEHGGMSEGDDLMTNGWEE